MSGASRVLVLGGAGFIGSHVTRRLVEAGARVVVIDGLLEGTGGRREHLEPVLPQIRFLDRRGQDVPNLAAIVGECDAVVDAMAWTAHRLALQNPVHDLHLNAASHLHVVQLLRRGQKAIYLGARSQFGNPPVAEIAEDSPMTPVDVQGIHKVTGESYYRVYARIRNFDAISLRFPNCFGERQPTTGEDIGLVGQFIRTALCGGTIEVFVEPLALDGGDEGARLYARARAHAAAGGRAAVVTRLEGDRGKLLVLDDSSTDGTLGDTFLDQRFATEARDVLARGTSRTLFIESTRAFVEVIAPPALLLVVGAGHVAMPLVTLARTLGYRTVVVDGRPRFASRERFPDVDELRVGIPSEVVADYALIPSTALVLVAHDYKYDLPVLRRALESEAGYIGMLGSTRRGATILRFLAEEGVSEAALARVRVPIGLDLGARSAPEIALAILAEIQAVRGGGSGQPLSARRTRP